MSTIEVYSRHGCTHCKRFKDQLNFYGIPFVERIIGQDITREQILEKFPGHNKLPIVTTEHGDYSGFEVDKMIEEYKEDFGKLLIME